MKHNDRFDLSAQGDDGGVASQSGARDDTSIGDLFKRLSDDMGDLVKQEMKLARTEVQRTADALGSDLRNVGIAVVIATIGALALMTFLIISIGHLLDDRYWLSSLLIGVIAILIGGIMAKSAIADMKRRTLLPEQTMQTLNADKAWAGRVAKELSHDLTTDPTKPQSRI